MTTIAGVVHQGRCYLGGDSAAEVEGSVYIQAEPKVFRRGPVLIGIVGSSPWEEMLRAFSPTRRAAAPTDREWLVDTLGAHVRRSGEWDKEDEALVGFRGALWCLEYTGAIWAVSPPYCASGSGADPACAVLRFTAPAPVRSALSLTPKSRILSALDMAAVLTEGTRPPFHVIDDGPLPRRKR